MPDSVVDLSHLHLLVTRPQHQAKTWAEQLQRAGVGVTQLPMLEIRPVEGPAQQAVKDLVLKLDEYQKLIFVSQNAVLHGLNWIDEYWPQLPTGLGFFAVGSATAKLLQERLQDLDPGFTGLVQTGIDPAMNSEAMLALTALQAVKGEKIAIVRGLGGRTLLGDTLSARGAQIVHIECYERTQPTISDWSLLDRFFQSGQQRIVSALSIETLQNLMELTPNNRLSQLRELPVLLPGERVAKAAREQGFKQVICADNASHQSLLEALMKV